MCTYAQYKPLRREALVFVHFYVGFSKTNGERKLKGNFDIHVLVQSVVPSEKSGVQESDHLLYDGFSEGHMSSVPNHS